MSDYLPFINNNQESFVPDLILVSVNLFMHNYCSSRYLKDASAIMSDPICKNFYEGFKSNWNDTWNKNICSHTLNNLIMKWNTISSRQNFNLQTISDSKWLYINKERHYTIFINISQEDCTKRAALAQAIKTCNA